METRLEDAARALEGGGLVPVIETPRRVDVRAIERELRALWQAASETSAAERVQISRAVTLTIVAYAPTPADASHLSDVIGRTSERHPARGILLVADSARDEPEAWVTARSHAVGRDRRQITCELITLRARPRADGRLLSLVRRLALPGMPVYLYWPGPVNWYGIFVDLLDVADHVIIDSAAFTDPLEALAAARRFVSDESISTIVHDLNWGRLTPWRGLTAQMFDPPYRTHVDRIHRVHVTYARSSPAQALLYSGWLAGRLRWRVDQPLRREATGWRGTARDRAGHRVPLELESTFDTSLADGTPVETTLNSGSPAGDGETVFSIVAGERTATLTVTAAHEAGDGSTRRMVPFDPPEEIALLAGELDVPGRDRVYEESLVALASLLGTG